MTDNMTYTDNFKYIIRFQLSSKFCFLALDWRGHLLVNDHIRIFSAISCIFFLPPKVLHKHISISSCVLIIIAIPSAIFSVIYLLTSFQF